MAELEVLISGDASDFTKAVREAVKGLNTLEKEGKETAKGLAGAMRKARDAINDLAPSLKTVAKIGTATAAAFVGLAAAVGIKAVNAAREQIRVENQLAAVLKSTGGAAGLVADELTAMAAELQKVTNFGDEATIGAQNILLTFTKIGRDVFPGATEAVLDMSVALGTDLKSSAILVGKALNDPIKGVSALGRSGVQFSEDQKKVIKALVETGKQAEAQAIILRELQTQFAGSARAAADPIIQLGNVLGDLSEELGRDLLPIVQDVARDLIKLAPAFSALGDSFIKMGVEAAEGGGIVKNVVEGIADGINFLGTPVAALISAFELLGNVVSVGLQGALAIGAASISGFVTVGQRAVDFVLELREQLAVLDDDLDLAISIRATRDELKANEKAVREFANAAIESAEAAADSFFSFEETFIKVKSSFNAAEKAVRATTKALTDELRPALISLSEEGLVAGGLLDGITLVGEAAVAAAANQGLLNDELERGADAGADLATVTKETLEALKALGELTAFPDLNQVISDANLNQRLFVEETRRLRDELSGLGFPKDVIDGIIEARDEQRRLAEISNRVGFLLEGFDLPADLVNKIKRIAGELNGVTAAANRARVAVSSIGGAGATPTSIGNIEGPFRVTGGGFEQLAPAPGGGGTFVGTGRFFNSRTGQFEGPSRQIGGPLRATGSFQGEEGEFVIREPAAKALGPLVLEALNNFSPLQVGNINLSGFSGQSRSLRSEARALLPELQREMSRGVRRARLA